MRDLAYHGGDALRSLNLSPRHAPERRLARSVPILPGHDSHCPFGSPCPNRRGIRRAEALCQCAKFKGWRGTALFRCNPCSANGFGWSPGRRAPLCQCRRGGSVGPGTCQFRPVFYERLQLGPSSHLIPPSPWPMTLAKREANGHMSTRHQTGSAMKGTLPPIQPVLGLGLVSALLGPKLLAASCAAR
jgi:hypothetical protein